jgi:L-alanine-DL-glutamate epimerase-like enolase superfamily enzyme
MKIIAARSRSVVVALTRPYAIAGGSWDSVEMALIELVTDDGPVGFGQASPAVEVTGETIATCTAELASDRLAWLQGREVADLARNPGEMRERIRGPAARAALDMALFDLESKSAGRPLVEHLGRVHTKFATSITIGLKSVDATLAEAREYFERGFRILKVKTGVDVDYDLERLSKLRECFGPVVTLRADANQGYDVAALNRFAGRMDALDLEMLEQPLPPSDDGALRTLPANVRSRLVADESVLDEEDLERVLADGVPFGMVNVKLMKCGGIRAALRIAHIAERANLRLMWGCMDESVLGISAALHAAYASRATHYLDLDGSLDLAADPFSGGFEISVDRLRTLARPGLGVEPR